MSLALAALIAAEGLPADYAEIVGRWWAPLADRIAMVRTMASRPVAVAVNGAQGTGKSTLCRCLEVLLAERHGLSAATLSLDDLYLAKAARVRLAHTVHPLLATRGPPGTHDTRLGAAVLTALTRGAGPVAIPRFDKATDDRRRRAHWPVVEAPVEVVLFEGWCVGATAEAPAALIEPVNRLEAEADPDGAWRTYVNTALAGDYQRLFAGFDLLVMLRPPDFAAVARWRRQQEARLRAATGGGMAEAAIDRFVMHYERLTRHMLRTMPSVADIVFDLGGDHRVAGATGSGPAG